eukprot:scaffold44279_cov33-Prasinocladus_malaysianus.AAC.1
MVARKVEPAHIPTCTSKSDNGNDCHPHILFFIHHCKLLGWTCTALLKNTGSLRLDIVASVAELVNSRSCGCPGWRAGAGGGGWGAV